MSANRRDVYIMRGTEDVDADDGEWVVPEPADEVIVSEIVENSDLSRDSVEPLWDHVEFERVHELLASTASDSAAVTFTIDGVEVTVTADGAVTVSA